MSLAIDLDEVVAVLLADGWHEVLESSFALDAYEFVWRELPEDHQLVYGGGTGGVPSTGFSFRAAEGYLYGPVTSVLAVRTRAR